MEEQKVQQPAKVGLVDMSNSQYELAADLKAHTDARNYIFRVLTEGFDRPELWLSSDLLTRDVSVDMNKLPSEVVELILTTVMEHEERKVFELWRKLLDTAGTACSFIAQAQKQQDTEEVTLETEVGETLKFDDFQDDK